MQNDEGPVGATVFTNEDEIEASFPDASHFNSRVAIANIEQQALIHEALENADAQSNVLVLEPILQALSVAGIRYPIGKTVCQICKGTCNKIMPAGSVDACKYKACVGFLGGYKGTKSEPSCSDVRRP